MRQRTILVMLVVFPFLLSGCSDSPERAAREWFDAMLNLDGNKILERTCLQQRAYIQEVGLWGSVVAMLPQLFGLDVRSQGDVSGLEFSTTSTNLDQTVATVRVHGEIRVAVLALAQAYPIDESWLMVKEEGVWRWCGTP
jgi:hypothetical protein